MIASRRLQLIMIVAGDLFLFYAALIATLAIRYLEFLPRLAWADNKWPFFFVHLAWIVIFYISGLYELRNLGSRKIVFRNVATTMAAGGIIAVLIFYLVPAFGITPKTNLFIDVFFVTILIFLWRQLFGYLTMRTSRIKVLFFGKTKEAEELVNHIKKYPHLGYEPAVLISGAPDENGNQNDYIKNIDLDHNLADIIQYYGIQLIAASKNILENQKATRRFYEVLPLGVSITNFPNFYEAVLGKIPVSGINESWFLENLVEINKKLYEIFKRIFDIIFATILGMPTLIILPVIAALIKAESRGPVFIRQKRTGKNGKVFELIKFRSMVALAPDGSAEKAGAEWAGKNDPRITRVGNILRKTRLDELPQLWNVLNNDMSFIGPRPERPEFIKKLEHDIPHYAMRHLVKPGLSGWAQINFPYGSSVEDAMEKLQYDLFYIKNRSFTIDLSIILRTIMTVIKGGGR